MTCKMNMGNGMLTVVPSKNVRIVHIETDLGIVNIHLRLHDLKGHRVEAVSMIGNSDAGEKKVTVSKDGRFIEEL